MKSRVPASRSNALILLVIADERLAIDYAQQLLLVDPAERVRQTAAEVLEGTGYNASEVARTQKRAARLRAQAERGPRGSEMSWERATRRPRRSEAYQAQQLHNTRTPGSPMYDW